MPRASTGLSCPVPFLGLGWVSIVWALARWQEGRGAERLSLLPGPPRVLGSHPSGAFGKLPEKGWGPGPLPSNHPVMGTRLPSLSHSHWGHGAKAVALQWVTRWWSAPGQEQLDGGCRELRLTA